jgi:multiple sugar transport system ATP-binding protein
MASVRFKNVSKWFGKIKVLHDINLEIKESEFVVLVGPSGCGKSTTLRLLAGLDDITEGDIYINDKIVNSLEPQHRNIAMVFQNYALYPHKNVQENIVFGLKRAKASKELIKNRLDKASIMLQLQDLLDRKPAQLSGGQRQRVAMGRAIVRDADVFLYDEPLSNLDAKLRSQMRYEIRRIHREYQTTSLYVTHDQVEAMTLGDRVVVMKDGFIEQEDSPMALYLKPKNIFVANFIGAPSMNILDATLYPGYIELENQRMPFDKHRVKKAIPSNGEQVKFGIRPDFFQDEQHISGSESLTTLKNVQVDIVEPLGYDREFNLKLGDQMLKARLDLRTEAQEGETINLCFDMNRAHVFDIESEKNLTLGI